MIYQVICLITGILYNILKIMKQSKANQITTEQLSIKKHGYQLAEPTSFTVPTASPKPSFFNTLFSFFREDSQYQNIFDPKASKTCTIFNQKMAILCHSNKLTVLGYNIIDEKFYVQSKYCILLAEKIKKVCCTYYNHLIDKIQAYEYFAVHYENSPRISLFKIDQYMNITIGHEQKQKGEIMALRFVSNYQIMVLLKDGRIYQYLIKQSRFYTNSTLAKVGLSKDTQLRNGYICTIQSEGIAVVCLFFLVFQKKHQRYQLHMKQYTRDSNNKLQQSAIIYDIFECKSMQLFQNQLLIYTIKDSLLIQQNHTVFVLQKKFGKYVKSDVISQIKLARSVIIIDKRQHVFICSIGTTSLQLWEIKLKDIGCNLQLLDVIQMDGQQFSNKLIKVWIFIKNKKPEFVILTDQSPRQVNFYLTKRVDDKLSKLMKLVKNQEKDSHGQINRKKFNSTLKKTEQLGCKLGYNKKQFYLNLWKQCHKNSNNIIQYLLPCKDFKVIFTQIMYFLRVKKLTASEIIRILKLIELSLLQELQISLDQELIKQYLKANFQRRKLRLYSGEIQLDFQDYEKIYNSSIFQMIQRSIDLNLFPQKFKHNIVWKEQKQENPIFVPYILKQFRLLILEDYPGFLLRLLSPYQETLTRVIQAYPYLLPQFPLNISIVKEELVLLSNIYQEEKIEEQQYSWLSFIRENEWERQSSSIDYLYSHLYKHHSTSTINDKLRQFRQSLWCTKNRYSTHILLETSKKQFQAKLPAIGKGSSLLFLCEKANRIALEKNRISQSEDLIQIMHKYNHLPIYEYYNYKFMCNLHYFLIKQKLVKPQTIIEELMSMKEQKLVACFFLGNKKRIQLLFTSISRLYSSASSFNRIIEAFVQSEECSNVQLEIFTNYIIKAGEKFQDQNQEIIGVIMMGFMKRIQLRQIDKAVQFLNKFRELNLCEELLKKISIFQSIKTQCSDIFKKFKLKNFTYETVIKEPQRIISSIVQFFFTDDQIRKKSVYIEQRDVPLAYNLNLFVVFLYLKDKVYSYGEEIQLYLYFCESILEWNQFDLIKKCFKDQIIIDDKQLLSSQFFTIVVSHMLSKYYNDENLLYNAQTNQHIKNLLSLIDESEQLAVVQLTKIEFATLLQSMNKQVRVQFMQNIKQQWQIQTQRKDIFLQIVDIFGQQIQFQIFIKIYEYLQKIRTGLPQVSIKSQQFVSFSLHLCKIYNKNHAYQNVCSVISFINTDIQDQGRYLASYNIMTECFLKMLNRKVLVPHEIRNSYIKIGTLDELEACRDIIDYYLSNYNKHTLINELFDCKFQCLAPFQAVLPDDIEIDNSYCYQGLRQFISRVNIWQMVVKKVISNSSNYSQSILNKDLKSILKQKGQKWHALDTKTIIFTYYFICSILHCRKRLFQVEEISFNHIENAMVLQQLSKDESLREAIDFKAIFLDYLRGLFKSYYLQISQIQVSPKAQVELPVLQLEAPSQKNQIDQIKQMDAERLVVFASDLSPNSTDYQLYRAIKRLVALYQNSKSLHKESSQRQKTLLTEQQQNDNSLPLYFDIRHHHTMKQSITQLHIPHNDLTLSKRTFRLQAFQKIKKEIVSRSNIVSQKMIIERVLDQLEHNVNQSNIASDNYLGEKGILHQLQEKNEENHIDIDEVLDDLRQDQIIQSVHTQLEQYKHVEVIHQTIEQMKMLIQLKDYERVVNTYIPSIILAVIQKQYYSNLIRSTTPGIRSKKRVNRANTLKQTILDSKIITILNILDGLKLFGNVIKVRILRSCLMIFSSEELILIDQTITKIFSLYVLLDLSRDINKQFTYIHQNIKEYNIFLEFEKFKMVIDIVMNFIKKCRSDQYFAAHKHYFKEDQAQAELYLLYLSKLLEKDIDLNVQLQTLKKIMLTLGKQQLLLIHQRLLQKLSGKELYLQYLELIHSIYITK